MALSGDEMDGPTHYYEVESRLDNAFSFQEPNPNAMEGIADLMIRMPVRPFCGDPSGIDSMENADCVGPSNTVLARLAHILALDYQENAAEVQDVCDFRTFVTDSNLQPDALHVVTRLSPKDGSQGEIFYGARVQRIEPERFALWSDH